MKEEWLFPNAIIPVDVETTAALVAEIKRLIDVVGGLVLKQGPDYERGFIDGMQKQMQSSVDKAVNAMAQPVQEPMAWMVYTQDGQSVYVTDNPTDIQEGQRALPLYATPQQVQESVNINCPSCLHSFAVLPVAQRTWVGLTDEEMMQIYIDLKSVAGFYSVEKYARDIEAKLKEKNT